MTNRERYKTLEERTNAFYAFCRNNYCGTCKNSGVRSCGRIVKCSYAWLELEANDEELLPCPFCGSDEHILVNKVFEGEDGEETTYVSCESCLYESPTRDTRDEAIAAHNRVARAVMASKEKEAK